MTRTIVKQGKNYVVYSDGTWRIDNVRASYPHCGKPSVDTDDEGNEKGKSYNIVGLLPKSTHVAVKDALVAHFKEMLAENKTKDLPSDKKFLRDGDKSGKETHEGFWTLSARETKRPKVRNTDNTPFNDIAEIDEQIYGGCWVTILIRPWWQNHKKHGKRINAGLSAVQLVKGKDAHGDPKPGAEAFGAGALSEDDLDETFSAVEDDGDAGFDDDDDNGGL